ncbi:hypothetical protein SAMN05216359_101405 [Roseateles sp. YR242]|uniref:hypothetical protein n=1 Tax=Roseateles sp. YR242 TaxID=1855305 RepID=UPI0008BA2739|nr:hypothetical protein [Roseateles sp. YR242]SEK31746.1 hypothetical protein SAMN05216359_101405 [Roseateles sp. YR242]
MQEMTMQEVEAVAGGLDAYTGAGLILGLAALPAAGTIGLAVGLGAAAGLVIAKVMSE